MSKHKKKSKIDWRTLIIAAILDFISSLIILIISHFLN